MTIVPNCTRCGARYETFGTWCIDRHGHEFELGGEQAHVRTVAPSLDALGRAMSLSVPEEARDRVAVALQKLMDERHDAQDRAAHLNARAQANLERAEAAEKERDAWKARAELAGYTPDSQAQMWERREASALMRAEKAEAERAQWQNWYASVEERAEAAEAKLVELVRRVRDTNTTISHSTVLELICAQYEAKS